MRKKSWIVEGNAPPSVVGMIGRKFGKWTVIKFVGFRKTDLSKTRNDIVAVHCDCGKNSTAMAGHIRSGRSTSCGCERTRLLVKRLTKHGFAPLKGKRKTVYNTWKGIKDRCYNINDNYYKYYGGRGIKVCDSWKNDFKSFLNDMGEKKPGMSIERIDVNGDYEPSNCLWIPIKDQAKNKRNNWTVELNGELMTAREATRRLGIYQYSIQLALKRFKKKKGEVHKIIPNVKNFGLIT